MANCDKEISAFCPIYTTIEAIGGSWKPLILWYLALRAKRFSELQRDIEGVTQKVLTQQLRELERVGLVDRKVYPEVPPRVEYSLTDRGKSLRPVMDAMAAWGTVQDQSIASQKQRRAAS
ncbi:MAG: winged helix-turn-helix transcriptional regulator [Bryobacteraceae bacterium]